MSKIFGENLREIRKAAQMPQYKLSIAMQVTQQTISSWESGRTEPNMGQMEQLCNILNCEMNDLLKNTYRPITIKDRELIDAYNNAPQNIQEAIRSLLGLGQDGKNHNQIRWYEDKRR
jgi:transcriptional regulator with XRE-family HTH domain